MNEREVTNVSPANVPYELPGRIRLQPIPVAVGARAAVASIENGRAKGNQLGCATLYHAEHLGIFEVEGHVVEFLRDDRENPNEPFMTAQPPVFWSLFKPKKT